MNKSRNRQLATESLESRQLLHGGGLSEKLIERTFDRLDTNDDGVILIADEGGDELSDRVWGSIAEADVEGSEPGITLEEFTSHLEAKQAEAREKLEARREQLKEELEKRREEWKSRHENQDNEEEVEEEVEEEDSEGDDDKGSRGRTIADHVERVFAKFDKVDEATGEADGLLIAEELGRWADNLAEVAGEDGMLSQEELTAHLEAEKAQAEEEAAQRREEFAEKMAERISGYVDNLFESRDSQDEATGEADGLLSAEELGRSLSRYLGPAAGDDGLLSKEELTSYLESRMNIGKRDDDPNESDAEQPTENEEEVDDEAGQPTSEVAAATVGVRGHRALINRARESARGRRRR